MVLDQLLLAHEPLCCCSPSSRPHSLLFMLAALQALPPRERNVIRLRFGLHDRGNGLPLHDIAAAYGLCKERIRQIEDAALSKLRSSGVRHGLLGDIEAA